MCSVTRWSYPCTRSERADLVLLCAMVLALTAHKVLIYLCNAAKNSAITNAGAR